MNLRYRHLMDNNKYNSNKLVFIFLLCEVPRLHYNVHHPTRLLPSTNFADTNSLFCIVVDKYNTYPFNQM